MFASIPFGYIDREMPETFGNIEEFYNWSGRVLWDFKAYAYNLTKNMNLYESRYDSIASGIAYGMERAVFEYYRPQNTYSSKAGVYGFFEAFEKNGAGDYDAFVKFVVEHALYSALSRLHGIYNADFFKEYGFPKGKPRLNMKRRYKAIARWVAEQTARATLRPMYDAWLNEQHL